MKKVILFLVVLSTGHCGFSQSELAPGAWKSSKSTVIIADGYISFAEFNSNPPSFINTYGGSYIYDGNHLTLTYEFNASELEKVGKTLVIPIKIQGEYIYLDKTKYNKIDNGSPGKLTGAWLFSGREREGEMRTRDSNVPRKTMKILSGTRFQWIAYNTESGEFFGTGGGTYTTNDGKYIENIDFFSRDNTRVGASLEFQFDVKDNTWHHKGFSSKGDPMYETWSLR